VILVAAGIENSNFIRMALQHNANPNSPSGEDLPDIPLVNAAYKGYFENVKILVAAGADVNAHHPRFSGYSAAEAAIGATGHYNIAVWLMENGYNHDLKKLAAYAESRLVPLGGEQQVWKEKLIGMLRARGLSFPAKPSHISEIKRRVVPAEEVEDIIMGRRNVLDYPLIEP